MRLEHATAKVCARRLRVQGNVAQRIVENGPYLRIKACRWMHAREKGKVMWQVTGQWEDTVNVYAEWTFFDENGNAIKTAEDRFKKDFRIDSDAPDGLVHIQPDVPAAPPSSAKIRNL